VVQGNALCLAARQLLGQALGELAQVEPAQCLLGGRARNLRIDPAEQQRQLDVLDDRQSGQEATTAMR